MKKYYCHSCQKEIGEEQKNICDRCWDNDILCDCTECNKFRGL